MNILITGVAGLLGARLADHIINTTNNTVIGIDNLSGGYRENVNSECIFYEKDLVSDDITDIFHKHRPDIVYHFAAYAAEGLSPFIRKFNYSNNIVGTMNIVNNCISSNVQRLIFTSSMAVYGKGNPPFKETDLPDPIDSYVYIWRWRTKKSI